MQGVDPDAQSESMRTLCAGWAGGKNQLLPAGHAWAAGCSVARLPLVGAQVDASTSRSGPRAGAAHRVTSLCPEKIVTVPSNEPFLKEKIEGSIRPRVFSR